MLSEKYGAGLKTVYVQTKNLKSCCLNVSKLQAETAHCVSWFHMRMVLGKEYRCEFTMDLGIKNFMLCPLEILTGMK